MALASGLCLLSAHGLRILRTPWPWLAVLLALLMVSPVLVWNAQQDWVSFRYQGQHGAGSGWHLAEVARFALLQLLAFGPLLLWGLWGHSKQGVLRLFFGLLPRSLLVCLLLDCCHDPSRPGFKLFIVILSQACEHPKQSRALVVCLPAYICKFECSRV
jgi:hypothetical protein